MTAAAVHAEYEQLVNDISSLWDDAKDQISALSA